MATTPRIDVVLLAAGSSSRLGRSKQLLPFGNSTLLRHLAGQALGSAAYGVRIVAGADHEKIGEHISDLGVTLVLNRRWSDGISSSIRAGLEPVTASADGVIIMLCDMPRVTSAHLNALISRYAEGDRDIVASRYQHTYGVPALFARRFFVDLTQLQGDAGAKSIIDREGSSIAAVDLPGGEIDIDTQEDVRAYLPPMKP